MCETLHARYFIMQHFGSPARLDGLVHSKSAGDLHQGMAATCGALAESSLPGGDSDHPCRMSAMRTRRGCPWPQKLPVPSQEAETASCCVSGQCTRFGGRPRCQAAEGCGNDAGLTQVTRCCAATSQG